MSAQRSVVLVDHPRRPLIRRAVLATLWAAAISFALATTKEIRPIYGHSPWLNDPYDTVISFAMFFIPLVAACLLVQVSLCLRSEPLPTVRVVAIVRACRVAVAVIVVDLASAWVALGLAANRSQWTLPATGIEVGLLGLATLATTMATSHLARLPRQPRPAGLHDLEAPDWLGDVVTVARRESRWFGPFRRLVVTTADWADRSLVRQVRRHPLVAAAVASAGFGITVGGWQGYREGYFLSVTLLVMGLGFCGMFAFLVPACSYFGLVRSARPSYGVQRRVLDASVAACAAAIVILAFRNSLWWVVGSNPVAAGPSEFAALVGSAVLVTFVMVTGAETLLRSHAKPARCPPLRAGTGADLAMCDARRMILIEREASASVRALAEP